MQREKVKKKKCTAETNSVNYKVMSVCVEQWTNETSNTHYTLARNNFWEEKMNIIKSKTANQQTNKQNRQNGRDLLTFNLNALRNSYTYFWYWIRLQDCRNTNRLFSILSPRPAEKKKQHTYHISAISIAIFSLCVE